MDSKGSQSVLLLLWLLCLHVVGLLIFTKGFLLTRVELQLYSDCKEFAGGKWKDELHTQLLLRISSNGFSSDCDQKEEEVSVCAVDPSHFSGCWSKPKVKKVVIVIIDAMRFDFAANVSNYHQPRGPWVGRLPVFERLLAKEGASAALFKFVADPPTTSLQRLKGLTTGGLPTFIDIGNSFGAPAITEDNLIAQLAEQGRRLVLLGDDTWLDVYPTQFTEVHPYPSFVVKDIHTVDNGVIKEIFPALKRDDWDVLIGHLLGVDHVGHTFDIASPTMLDKLDQMNSVIEDIVSALQAESEGLHEDTLLIVMGDHAQTVGGDHGGGTPEETDSALFALSMRKPPAGLPPHFRSAPCNAGEGRPSACVSTLPQVDFAPTLAMLLGVPIPYASVGKVSFELWAICPDTWTDPEPLDHSSNSSDAPSGKDVLLKQWMEGYLRALSVNSLQVQRYLDRYSEAASAPFPAVQLAKVRALHEKATASGGKLVTCQMRVDGNSKRISDSEQPLESEILRETEAVRSHVEVEGKAGRVRNNLEQVQEEGICAASKEAFTEDSTGGQRRSMKQGTSPESSEDQLQRLDELKAAIAAHVEHLTSAAELARAQWTQFGAGAMVLGLTVLAASLLAHTLVFCALCLNPQTLSSFLWSKMLRTGACVGLMSGMCAYFVPPAVEGRSYTSVEKLVRSGAGEGANALLVGSGSAALVSVAVLCWHVMKRHVASEEVSATRQLPRALGRQRGKAKDCLVLLLTAFHAGSMISDNCIIWEGEFSVLLSGCIALLYLWEAWTAADSARMKDALLMLVATSVLGWLGLRKSSTLQGGSASGVLSPPLTFLWTTLWTSLPLFLLLRLFLKTLPDDSRVWTGFRTCASLQYALVGGYWLAEDPGASSLEPSVRRSARLASPRAVYGLGGALVLGLIASVVNRGTISSGSAKRPERSRERLRKGFEGRESNGGKESGGPVKTSEKVSDKSTGVVTPRQPAHPGVGQEKSSQLQAQLCLEAGSSVRSSATARVSALVTVLSGVLALLLGRKGPLLLLAAGLHATGYLRLQMLHGNENEQRQRRAGAKTAHGTGNLKKYSELKQRETSLSHEELSVREPQGKEQQAEALLGRQICSLGPDACQEEISSGHSSNVASTLQSTAEVEYEVCASVSRLLRPAAIAGEWSIFTTQLFFCTGHRCSFDALQYTAAFVGFEAFSFARSGTLLAASTFSSHILMAVSLPLLASTAQEARAGPLTSLGREAIGYGLARALPALLTTGTVAVLRRHLMVWSIFAPKFVFESCYLLVTDVLLVLVVTYTEAACKEAKKR